MKIAVLVKQVPRGESQAFVDGRLDRSGTDLEVNAYCRRANAKAVELAGDDGEVVVFTMGPPAAEDAVREMIACGATRAVHVCDPVLAGSDTLVTARVLAAAVYAEGPFDLIFCGLNSIDADTGQVGPQLAELLGVPFVPAAKQLHLAPADGGSVVLHVGCELDNAFQEIEVGLPAVVSTAERLCDPSKADPLRRAAVPADTIRRTTARELGFRSADVGQAGSPTWVGVPAIEEVGRASRLVGTGREAVEVLDARGAFAGVAAALEPVPATRPGPLDVWCVLDPIAEPVRTELLGEAAALAAQLGGNVTAAVAREPERDLGPEGADRVAVIGGSHSDDWGDALAGAIGIARPRIVLVEGTAVGRVVASTVAARHGWGLTGDGIRIDASPDGALTVWKPALGGQMTVPITSTSPVQMATIRPGVLPRRSPRASTAELVYPGHARRYGDRVRVLATGDSDDGRAELAGARVVIAVGQGVDPADYPELERLRSLLGATIGATRKVTDRGWMPRSRQIGITGASLSPDLLISIGASGRFNHTCGFRAARHVLALNADPAADIFACADVGVVGDWRIVIDEIADEIASRQLAAAR